MNLKQCFLTKNDCYKSNKSINPIGIVVHSTGANNPTLRRYVQPDDGKLGTNPNSNDWNRDGLDVCVHAFIGQLANKDIATYQTLPWNMRCWGCGSGKNGSYNNSHIQFEICEDSLNDETYFLKVMDEATDLCVSLCKQYGIKISEIVSHKEAYQKGCASGHMDCDHWLTRFGWTMNTFRAKVEEKMNRISYRVHQQSYGWSNYVLEEEVAGITGRSKRLEAIQIDPKSENIFVKAHIQGLGWVDYGKINKDTIIGTVGQKRRLEAIEFKGAKIMCHIQSIGWASDYAEMQGTVGLGKRIEAIKIKL